MHAPQDFASQFGNHDGRNRPDGGLEVLKGLDAAIRDHGKAVDGLATSITTHAKATSELQRSVDGFSSGLILVGAVCLLIGCVIGWMVGNGPRRP